MATVNEKMTAIADAIRNKTGGTEALTLDGMASGVNEVYNAGKKTSYDEFWDNLQNYGKLSCYDEKFREWAGEYCRPKYKVIPTVYGTTIFGCMRLMYSSNVRIVEKEYFDLSQIGLPTGSSSAGWRQTFQKCTKLEIVEDIGMQPACYYFAFYGCTKLHTIEVLRFAEDTKHDNGFVKCTSLSNITIEGTIGQNLSFASSPLSVDSIKSVITHLKDYSDSTETHTLTLSSTSKSLLEAEGATSPNGNTWSDYINDLGWTLL